jgi:hypothetical protein
MLKQLQLFPVCLTIHDGGAAAPAAGGTPQAGTQQPAQGQQAETGDSNPVVLYGKQPDSKAPAAGEKQSTQTNTQQPDAETPEARKARYEQLIKGEFKDLFTADTQQIINRRFKEVKTLEENLKAYDPLVDILAAKYDLKDTTPQKLVEAIEKDTKFFEDLADSAGMTVEQFKSYLALQRENANLRNQINADAEAKKTAQRNIELNQQAAALKAKYPSFDMMAEITNAVTGAKFAELLNLGVDVKSAFEAVHFDEIMSGAIVAAGKKAEENVISNIQAKGARPKEAGIVPNPGVIVKQDPSQFTQEDMEEIRRRVERGERIVL